MKPYSFQRGVTLIELVIGMAIVAMLVSAGLPSFMQWMQNAQVRAAAEGLQTGLQLARAEAVRRNTPVRFQLTSTLTNACALSPSGKNWVISLNSAASACATPPANPPLPPTAPDPANPYIIRVGSTTEGAINAVIGSKQVDSAGDVSGVVTGLLTFNGWGRVAAADLAAGNNLQIDVTNPTIGTCMAASGPVRCLRVIVSSTGQIQICDPALNSPPGACPW